MKRDDVRLRNMQSNYKGRPKARINALSLAKLIGAVLGEGSTVYDIADVTGMNTNVIRGYVNAMHREGVMRIKAWELDNRGAATRKVWVLGKGKDAPRPGPAPSSVLEQRRRDRRAASAPALRLQAALAAPIAEAGA